MSLQYGLSKCHPETEDGLKKGCPAGAGMAAVDSAPQSGAVGKRRFNLSSLSLGEVVQRQLFLRASRLCFPA